MCVNEEGERGTSKYEKVEIQQRVQVELAKEGNL
jgi:hypothetical protein